MFILMQAQHDRGTNEINTTLIGTYASYKGAHDVMTALHEERSSEYDNPEWSHVEDFEIYYADEFDNYWHWFIFDTDDPREFTLEGGDDLFYED